MEFTLRTLVIIVMCVIVLLAIIMLFMYNQGQSKDMIDSIFSFFRSVGV